MHESFLNHKSRRWLKVGCAVVLASVLAYAIHSPRVPANGATWLGYTLGTIGALLIFWLMLLGVRKRRYRSTLGTVKGWLSAHIYLGLALIFVATLHTGFQFGWNLHTLAYTLMCIVIGSGIFGVLLYWRYPTLMSEARGNQTTSELLVTLAEFDNQLQRAAEKLPTDATAVISSSIAGTQIGGKPWQLVSSKDRSEIALPTGRNGKLKKTSNVAQNAAITWVADAMATSTEPNRRDDYQAALTLLGNKQSLLQRLREYSRVQAMLQIWLALHIPLSFGLLAALVSHIVVVFFYW